MSVACHNLADILELLDGYGIPILNVDIEEMDQEVWNDGRVTADIRVSVHAFNREHPELKE